MSGSRPKLVQEGAPLDGSEEFGTGSSTLASASAASKSKYRLVVGGSDEPLPDDPDQGHYMQYDHGYRGRGGGRGRGRYDYNYHRGGGRYNNRYDYRRGGGRYDSYRGGGRGYGYDNRYHGGHDHQYSSGRKIIKNPKAPGLINTRFVIGNDDEEEEQPQVGVTGEQGTGKMDVEQIIPQTYNEELHQIERMEGVISLDAKEPLVVMDGANVAYAYSDATAAVRGGGKREPDYRGLQVASSYFLEAGIRVLIVLPAPWFRVKPAAGDPNTENAIMVTEKVEALRALKEQGLLVAAPPKDDDDAYAITIARRENTRAKERGEGAGYVLSNDYFRDACGRDMSLDTWLHHEWGRMSYAFCDLGTQNDHGQRVLDFIPNPRHPLVSEVERQRHS